MASFPKKSTPSKVKSDCIQQPVKRKASAFDFQLKYKTELCKNFEKGFCEYGEACAFAHGASELRSMSKKCIQFFQNGFCTYGDQCQFSHQKEMQTIKLKNSQGRLPIFLELEKRNI